MKSLFAVSIIVVPPATLYTTYHPAAPTAPIGAKAVVEAIAATVNTPDNIPRVNDYQFLLVL